jgi:hypothetical protein
MSLRQLVRSGSQVDDLILAGTSVEWGPAVGLDLSGESGTARTFVFGR